MIKLETHCHTLGGSTCATTPVNVIANVYKAAGYGAIVVTNHFNEYQLSLYPGKTRDEKLAFYFSLVREAEEAFAEAGIRTFFGAEIAINPEAEGYAEYMVYGLDKSHFYDNPPLYALTQKELFKVVEDAGGFMYQTHPFRPNVVLGNPLYMHGAEAFNGHFHHDSRNELAEKFCEENGLVKMSGTDFHHDDQPVTAGILIPDEIADEAELVKYIMRGKAELIKNEKLYKTRLVEYFSATK